MFTFLDGLNFGKRSARDYLVGMGYDPLEVDTMLHHPHEPVPHGWMHRHTDVNECPVYGIHHWHVEPPEHFGVCRCGAEQEEL